MMFRLGSPSLGAVEGGAHLGKCVGTGRCCFLSVSVSDHVVVVAHLLSLDLPSTLFLHVEFVAYFTGCGIRVGAVPSLVSL